MLCGFLSCQNKEKKPIKIIEKNFGSYGNEIDSIAVELNLAKTKNWKELLKQTERIVCNDSIPKVTIKNDSVIKRIYLDNICWKSSAGLLIMQRNTLEIHNDTVNKLQEDFYPLDSLPKVLKRDLENNGKNPDLCDSPEKLLIYISYDNNGMDQFLNTLNKLITSFEKVTDKKYVRIFLSERIVPPLPPSSKVQ